MNILITGGAGYIGSAISSIIHEETNHHVEIYDTFPAGSVYVNRFLNNDRFTFSKADIRDSKMLETSIAKADVIIHLAGIVGFPACDANPYEAKSCNEEGTRILVSLKGTDQMLVFASTGSVYGAIDGICTEEKPTNPVSLYGKTKVVGERLVEEADGISLRLATLCGLSNKMRDDLLIHTLCKSAVTDNCIALFQGNAMRTFLEVNDAARCFVQAAEGLIPHPGIYNVGAEELNFSKKEIAQKICAKTGASLLESNFNSDPDKRDYEVSYAKIRATGFRHSQSIDPILDRVISYYKVNG